MIRTQIKVLIIVLIMISNLSYSQNKIQDNNCLIDITIRKYSRHLFLRTLFSFTIASIRDYNTKNYWVISYLPEKHNRLMLQLDSLNPNKIDLAYNKVKLIGNHPVFWNEPNDTSDYDFVIKTMIRHNLIDTFFINSDSTRIHKCKDYPKYVLDDRAIVVYYVIRRSDLNIIHKFRTRKYWKIYDYMDKLK